MIFTLYSPLPFSQKKKNESGKSLRFMPMKYIKLMILSLQAQLPFPGTTLIGTTRQGVQGKQPIIA